MQAFFIPVALALQALPDTISPIIRKNAILGFLGMIAFSFETNPAPIFLNIRQFLSLVKSIDHPEGEISR